MNDIQVASYPIVAPSDEKKLDRIKKCRRLLTKAQQALAALIVGSVATAVAATAVAAFAAPRLMKTSPETAHQLSTALYLTFRGGIGLMVVEVLVVGVLGLWKLINRFSAAIIGERTEILVLHDPDCVVIANKLAETFKRALWQCHSADEELQVRNLRLEALTSVYVLQARMFGMGRNLAQILHDLQQLQIELAATAARRQIANVK